MATSIKKQAWFFAGTVAAVLASALLAFGFERDFGKIDVQSVRIVDPSGYTIAAKIFRPKAASAKNKMPGVINLHGGANDKGCQDSVSIELAKRGIVVIATDGLGHGDSKGAYQIGRVFGDPTYTFGASVGYAFLKTLPFVDVERLAVTGHSMGGGNSLKIANFNPEVKAIASVDGGVGTPANKNVLFIQPRLADMAASMDDLPPVDPKAFGVDGPVEWGKTYGSFADGTARRAVLVPGNHHTLTLQPKAVAEVVDWLGKALKPGDATWLDSTKQTYMWKEIFGLIALLGTLVSLIPLTNLLLSTAFFKPVAQPLSKGPVVSTGAWWLFATVNALIGGLFFIAIGPKGGGIISKIFKGMNMLRVDGISLWYLASAVLGVVLIYAWYAASGKKAGFTSYDLGISFDKDKARIDWAIVGKTALVAAILFAWMYAIEGFSQWAMGQEFRFGWPFMRQFSDARRLGQFLINMIPALLFFLINGGVFMFGQARMKEYGGPAKTQLVWWLKVVYASLFGMFLVWAIQYLPWAIAGTGPLIPGSLDKNFAVWPLLLWMYLPEFAILLFFLTWFFRRTGKIYLGAMVVSSLVVWFMTAGLNFTQL